MPIHFTKMSGAGNDFIVIDNRQGIVPERGRREHHGHAGQAFSARDVLPVVFFDSIAGQAGVVRDPDVAV